MAKITSQSLICSECSFIFKNSPMCELNFDISDNQMAVFEPDLVEIDSK